MTTLQNLRTKATLPGAIAVLICVLFGVMLGVLSVKRYTAYNTGMSDLGNMSQAIWSATQGHPLVFTFDNGQLSRLALHVEVIYLVIAPLYALFPSPVTLVILQAGLYALGGIPVYRLATRKLQSGWGGVSLVLVYLLYPIVQTAVLFDFHGDTLAMPFLLFAIEALDRKAWKSYAIWILLALLCKFYVALPVAALGAALWLQGQHKAGFWTAAAAVAYGAFAFFVIRSIFAPPVVVGEAQSTTAGYVQFYFSSMLDGLKNSWLQRTIVAMIVFLPALWVGFRSPIWLIPAAAVALPALLSNGPGPSFYYAYHHYALAAPFLVAAVIYGAGAIRDRVRDWKKGPQRTFSYHFWLGITLVFTLLVDAMFVDTPLNPTFFREKAGDPNLYARTERDVLKDRWLKANIPDGMPIMASPMTASHLTRREILFLTDNPESDLSKVEAVVIDGLFDFATYYNGELSTGGVIYDLGQMLSLLEYPDLQLVDMRDGLMLYRRNPPTDQVIHFSSTTTSGQSLQTLAETGGMIGLVSSQIEPQGDGTFTVTCSWTALQPLDQLNLLVAVSRLEVLDGNGGETSTTRILHLPTLTVSQTLSWQMGQVITEEFDVRVPEELPPGTYRVLTGWYDSSNRYAAFTDERARIGEEIEIGEITFP
jgi:uncharacterized membrane protein